MPYCSVDDVKLAANRWADLSTEENTRALVAIARAQAIVEHRTGTFWDQRLLQVTTEPLTSQQRRLFMPANIISLTSVTEQGVDITSSVLSYGTWIEKNASAALPWPGEAASNAWACSQQSVVVVGTFGMASTPADIVAITAHLAAMILGWVEKSFTTADGISASIRDLKLPDWVAQALDGQVLEAYDVQPTVTVEL